jgi:hypothetical protein
LKLDDVIAGSDSTPVDNAGACMMQRILAGINRPGGMIVPRRSARQCHADVTYGWRRHAATPPGAPKKLNNAACWADIKFDDGPGWYSLKICPCCSKVP